MRHLAQNFLTIRCNHRPFQCQTPITTQLYSSIQVLVPGSGTRRSARTEGIAEPHVLGVDPPCEHREVMLQSENPITPEVHTHRDRITQHRTDELEGGRTIRLDGTAERLGRVEDFQNLPGRLTLAVKLPRHHRNAPCRPKCDDRGRSWYRGRLPSGWRAERSFP